MPDANDLASLPPGQSGGGEPTPSSQQWTRHTLGEHAAVEPRRSALSSRPEEPASAAEAPAPAQKPEPELTRGQRAVQLARERAAAAATAAKERASGKVAGSDAAGIAAFTDSVDAFVKANADRFPVTNALNNGRAVAEFIVSEFARTRRLMPVEEAARFLERHYFNESKRLHDQFRPVAHLLDAEEGPAADLSDARPIDDRERLRRARAILDASLRKKKR